MPKVGDLEYFGEDMSDHEWGTSTSAACCLKIMAYLMKDEILDPVIDHAGGLTVSDSPQDRYVGLLTLGAVIDGPSKNAIRDKFRPALEVLFQLLDDQHRKVRENSAWMFNVLVEASPELFDVPDQFKSLVDRIGTALRSDKVVGGKMCQFIAEFAH